METKKIMVDRDTAEVFAVSLEDNLWVYPEVIEVDYNRLAIWLHGGWFRGDERVTGSVEIFPYFFYAEGEAREEATKVLDAIQDLAGVRALLPSTYGYRIYEDGEEQ